MKKYVSLLALFFVVVGAYAGEQLVMGLTSKNLYALGVWENNKGQLKHYIYIYSKSQKQVKLVINLKKYKGDVTTGFEEVKAGEKELYKTELAPGRITKLDYPPINLRLNFMEFVEDGKSIGLLDFNTSEPERVNVEEQYKFYINNGINGGKENFWIKLESISEYDKKMGISYSPKNPNEVYFIKVLNEGFEPKDYEGKLDSLKQTDKDILKFDPTTVKSESKLTGNFGPQKIVLVYFVVDIFENGKKKGSKTISVPMSKNG